MKDSMRVFYLVGEKLVEEYELYPLGNDTSDIIVVYRGQPVIEPLYLNLRELDQNGVPVKVSKSKYSSKGEVLYPEKSGYYDEPEFVDSDQEDKEREIKIQGERIDELEDDIDRMTSFQEMQRWVMLLGGIIVGLLLMYGLTVLNSQVLIT